MANKKAPIKKKTKISKVNFPKPFWRSKLGIIAMAFFAVVGTYLIYQAFAASVVGSIEAENMPAVSGSVEIQTGDSSASNLTYVRIPSPATIKGTFSTNGAGTSLSVVARSRNCDGTSIASVSVDGGPGQSISVTSVDKWATYTLPVTLPAGNHTITATHTNYYRRASTSTTSGCSRNLYFDVFRVNGETIINSPNTATIVASADTYVSKNNPSSSYGTSSSIRLDGDDGGDSYMSYLKFDLSSLSGKTVTGAKLQWNVTNNSADVFNIHQTDNASWAENVNYGTRPTFSSSVVASTSGNNKTGLETIDVTNFVKAKTGQVVGIALDGSGPDGYAFSSKESTIKPTIVVTLDNGIDTSPPSVSFSGISNGQTLSGTASFTAKATDNVSVSKVEFSVDGKVVQTTSAQPYSFAWDTLTATNGSHNLSLKAYDSVGLSSSANISVNVSNSAQQPVSGNNCNATAPTGYTTLKFCDDFEGTALDKTKWNPNWFTPNNTYYSHAINDNDNNCYDNRNVSVAGGMLVLSTNVNTNPVCTYKDPADGIATYTGSIVSSIDPYKFQYGYIEARIWMDGENGKVYNWPTFWTNGKHDPGWPDHGEIDIAEVSSDHVPNDHYHYGPQGSDKYNGFGDGYAVSPTPGWHTYAIKWEAGKLTWIYDGNVVDTLTSDVTPYEQYILFDNKFRRENISPTLDAPLKQNPVDTSLVGKLMKVDYVRVWN